MRSTFAIRWDGSKYSGVRTGIWWTKPSLPTAPVQFNVRCVWTTCSSPEPWLSILCRIAFRIYTISYSLWCSHPLTCYLSITLFGERKKNYTPTLGTIWAVYLVPSLNTVWLKWLGSLSHIGGHPLESRPNLTARRTAENNSRCSFRKVICVIVASVSKELTEQAYEIRTSGDLYLKQVWHIY